MKKVIVAAVIVWTVVGASAAFCSGKDDQGPNDVLHLGLEGRPLS